MAGSGSIQAYDIGKTIIHDEAVFPRALLTASDSWARMHYSTTLEAFMLMQNLTELADLRVGKLLCGFHTNSPYLDATRIADLTDGGGTTLHTHPLTIEVTAATNMDVNTRYVANNISQIELTMPTAANVGDTVYVIGKGNGGWKILQNAGQTIHYAGMSTTTGATGYLEALDWWNIAELTCITANTDFVVTSANGELKGG